MAHRCHRIAGVTSCRSHHGNVLRHGLAALLLDTLFSSACRCVACSYQGAIDIPLCPVDVSTGIELNLQGLYDTFPGAIVSPSRVAFVDRLPGSIAFGNVTPGGTTT